MSDINKKINYTSRNYVDVRGDLVNLLRLYYPDIFSDFNDSSVGQMLIDLNAAVADMLSFHTDRKFNETQLDNAEERSSVLNIARTLGLKIPGNRASVSVVDFSFNVPVFGDTFDIRYAPTIKYGARVSGGGQVFETISDIDFSSAFSSSGLPNRLIIPNFDNNNNLVNYTLVKREIVVNGITKVFRKVINVEDSIPFFELFLPDNNVLSVENVITFDNTSRTTAPTFEENEDFDLNWYEVDSLAEDKIFIDNGSYNISDTYIKRGKWVNIKKKFITEYTDKGFLKLTFGSGTDDLDMLEDIKNNNLNNLIKSFVNTTSLGLIPKPNTTMFVRYRVGGGSGTNVGVNVINTVDNVSIFTNGPLSQINNLVNQTLKVNNPLPAIGGQNQPSIEYIKKLIRFNFSSQNRAVVLKDYYSIISKMPGNFGTPYRIGLEEESNKINVHILTLNSDGKLRNTSNDILKENIATWLADYRMINDYVQILDGKIYNIGVQYDVYIDKKALRGEVFNNIINTTKEFFNISKQEMGENFYLGNLLEAINNVPNILNVINMRFFNKIGENKYSLNEVNMPYIDDDTREIDTSTFTLLGDISSMYEIKFPETDISVRFLDINLQ
jgi:hypothetical protein